MQQVKIIPAVIIVNVVVEFIICSVIVIVDSVFVWHLRSVRPISTEIVYFGGWKNYPCL